MNILAIETSCDDTCVAIIKVKKEKGEVKNFEILSNIVSSQVKIHQKYGGVYPFLAKREHQKNLPIVLKKALKKAKNPKINLMAVTIGPGLEPCLWTGVNFAKGLAKKLNLKIVPVNHIEAHIFSNWLDHQLSIINNSALFPAVCLIVSGGHTQLILMRDICQYKILGETRDDAAGECFDKVARILGLGYPGGPAIAKEAEKFQGIKQITLPRPMIFQKNYDFSFSGLKTAVLYNFKNQPEKIKKSKKYIREVCAEVQQAVIDVLIHKTFKAVKNYKVKTIILGGGVAANYQLREQLKEKIQKELPFLQYLFPEMRFCTDNGAMVAVAGYFRWLKGKVLEPEKIKAIANLRV